MLFHFDVLVLNILCRPVPLVFCNRLQGPEMSCAVSVISFFVYQDKVSFNI